MCVTNTTGRRPQALSFASNVTALVPPSTPSACNASSASPAASASAPPKTVREVSEYSNGETSVAVPFSAFPASVVNLTGCNKTETKAPRPKRRRRPQKPGLTAKNQERHFVRHNYHDHALELPGTDGHDYDSASTDGPPSRRRTGAAISFPLKLHTMLSQIEADGLAHVVSWQPHGRCFVIHKPKDFVEFVMPKYFRQSKLTSFQRQLNLYGFQRLTRGPDERGYYHELFLRGKTFLCKKMTRTKVKGTKFKAASSPDQEPDFYSMPPVVVTPEVSDASDHDTSSTHSDELRSAAPAPSSDLPNAAAQEGSLPKPPPLSSKFIALLAESLSEEDTIIDPPKSIEIDYFGPYSPGQDSPNDPDAWLGEACTTISSSGGSDQLDEESISVERCDDSGSLIGDIMQMWYPESPEPEPGFSIDDMEDDAKFGRMLEMIISE